MKGNASLSGKEKLDDAQDVKNQHKITSDLVGDSPFERHIRNEK